MKDEIVLYQPNEQLSLEVKVENDTVWLNRNQMAVLFDRDVKTIGKHINNALREELAPTVAKNATLQNDNPTVAKFAIVQQEGNRSVVRQVEFYSLDVILSVGFRVKSSRGIEFRRWANRVLNELILRGYTINQRLLAVEDHVDKSLMAMLACWCCRAVDLRTPKPDGSPDKANPSMSSSPTKTVLNLN